MTDYHIVTKEELSEDIEDLKGTMRNITEYNKKYHPEKTFDLTDVIQYALPYTEHIIPYYPRAVAMTILIQEVMSDPLEIDKSTCRNSTELYTKSQRELLISTFTTIELILELCKRKGVRLLELEKNEEYCIASKERHCIFGNSASIILVVE